MSEHALKPCPFCGEDAHVDTENLADAKFHTVGCHTENCQGASFPQFGTPAARLEEAIEKWNRRA